MQNLRERCRVPPFHGHPNCYIVATLHSRSFWYTYSERLVCSKWKWFCVSYVPIGGVTRREQQTMQNPSEGHWARSFRSHPSASSTRSCSWPPHASPVGFSATTCLSVVTVGGGTACVLLLWCGSISCEEFEFFLDSPTHSCGFPATLVYTSTLVCGHFSGLSSPSAWTFLSDNTLGSFLWMRTGFSYHSLTLLWQFWWSFWWT